MEKNCQQEVITLHQFFADWFNGTLPQTDEAFARFANVMNTEFYIVGPDGRLTPREPLLEQLWAGHGRWQGSDGRISIRNFQLRRQHGDLFWATYEEWQTTGDKSRGRLSTVLFQTKRETPNGLVWLLVHETWLPADG